MKKVITHKEYVVLEGLFSIMKTAAAKIELCESAAADVLRNKDEEDDYDACYPLVDNIYEGNAVLLKKLRNAGIKITPDKPRG